MKFDTISVSHDTWDSLLLKYFLCRVPLTHLCWGFLGDRQGPTPFLGILCDLFLTNEFRAYFNLHLSRAMALWSVNI